MRTTNTLTLLALGLGALLVIHCGGDDSSGSSGNPPPGPTNLVVSWAFAGKAASADECAAREATQVYVNLSGTIDPALHQKTTEDCASGSVTFPDLDVQKLGTPFLEGILLDKDGKSIAQVGVTVEPTPGSTNVTLDFFGGAGGAGGSPSSSSSTASSSSSSTTGGMGGMGGAGGMSGAGGMGGVGGTNGVGGAGGN